MIIIKKDKKVGVEIGMVVDIEIIAELKEIQNVVMNLNMTTKVDSELLIKI